MIDWSNLPPPPLKIFASCLTWPSPSDNSRYPPPNAEQLFQVIKKKIIDLKHGLVLVEQFLQYCNAKQLVY